MFFKEIHHVAINASNYQATKNFYVEKLGFEVLRENHRPEKNDIKLDLKLAAKNWKFSFLINFQLALLS